MQKYLKITISVLVSWFFMVFGTGQAAQTEEVGLDFSVPEADITTTATTLTVNESLSASSDLIEEAIATQSAVKSSKNAAKAIALDFSVPNADSPAVPVLAESSAKPTPTNPTPTPSPITPNTPPPSTPSTPEKPKDSTKQLIALRRAIVGQESAGNFRAVNPDSGALGYGQLMRKNVAPWTKAALGRALTPEEFLANPGLQIQTIDHKLNEYLQRELAYTKGKNEELAIRRVASTWYSGNPNLWNNTRPQYYKGRPYPSIASYTRSVWRRYLQEK